METVISNVTELPDQFFGKFRKDKNFVLVLGKTLFAVCFSVDALGYNLPMQWLM